MRQVRRTSAMVFGVVAAIVVTATAQADVVGDPGSLPVTVPQMGTVVVPALLGLDDAVFGPYATTPGVVTIYTETTSGYRAWHRGTIGTPIPMNIDGVGGPDATAHVSASPSFTSPVGLGNLGPVPAGSLMPVVPANLQISIGYVAPPTGGMLVDVQVPVSTTERVYVGYDARGARSPNSFLLRATQNPSPAGTVIKGTVTLSESLPRLNMHLAYEGAAKADTWVAAAPTGSGVDVTASTAAAAPYVSIVPASDTVVTALARLTNARRGDDKTVVATLDHLFGGQTHTIAVTDYEDRTLIDYRGPTIHDATASYLDLPLGGDQKSVYAHVTDLPATSVVTGPSHDDPNTDVLGVYPPTGTTIASADVTYTKTPVTGPVERTYAHAEKVPPTTVFSRPGHIEVIPAGDTIGLVEAGVSKTRGIELRRDVGAFGQPPAYDYLQHRIASDTDSSTSFLARDVGHTVADYNTARIDADVNRRENRLRAFFKDDRPGHDLTTELTVPTLPSHVHLVIEKDADGALSRLQYVDGAPIGELTADLWSGGEFLHGGLSRVRYAQTLVRGLFAGTAITFPQGGIALQSGTAVGEVRVRLASAPSAIRDVDAGSDGVVLHDRPDSFALGAHITGLVGLQLSSTQTPFAGMPSKVQTIAHVGLQATGGRPLVVRTEGRKNAHDTNTLVTGAALPSSIAFDLISDDLPSRNTRLNVDYVASSRVVGGMTFHSDVSGGSSLDATVNPIPKEFHLCTNETSFCGSDAWPSNGGSLNVKASEDITIGLTKYPDPNNTAYDFIKATGLKLREMYFQTDSRPDCADTDNSLSAFYIGTGNYLVNGRLESKSTDVCGDLSWVKAKLVDVHNGGRFVEYKGTSVNRSAGELYCASGTTLDYYVSWIPGNFFDIADDFCTGGSAVS